MLHTLSHIYIYNLYINIKIFRERKHTCACIWSRYAGKLYPRIDKICNAKLNDLVSPPLDKLARAIYFNVEVAKRQVSVSLYALLRPVVVVCVIVTYTEPASANSEYRRNSRSRGARVRSVISEISFAAGRARSWAYP